VVVFDKFCQSFQMEVIDDLGVIAIFGKVLPISIKLLNFFEESFFEIVFDG
jgi:hypothetical protein